uniref:Uncharacterized protein n=1 Tax=Symphyocladiella dendroidea TaxID=2506487 RepID=A0A1Z1M799_9FLOR|nr:hypothetical protein [Symphyocladiella dendroidea]ARW61859.1 hypothetical protein [Symphyocladiella dendroidea]
MNFLHHISSQDYIDLNLKCYHKKNIYSIQLITIIFLMSLPYIFNIDLPILMFFMQITLAIVFKDLYLIKLFTLYKQLLLFSLSTIFFNYFVNYNEYTHRYINHLYIPYFFKITLLSYSKQFIYKLSAYYLIYQIPKYITHIIVLNTLYIIICYNISVFIKSETINKALYVSYTYITKVKVNLYNIIIINILISSQLLEKTIERINSTYLGVQLKTTANNKEIIKYIVFYNNKLFDQMLKDQNNLNITLWNRSVHNKFKNKIYID